MSRHLPAGEWRMTGVDRSEFHLHQAGLLFLPFAHSQDGDLIRTHIVLT